MLGLKKPLPRHLCNVFCKPMLPGWERKGPRLRKVGSSFENVSSIFKTRVPIHVLITVLILYVSLTAENTIFSHTIWTNSHNYLAGVLGRTGPGWAGTKGPMGLRGPRGPRRCLKGWYSPTSVCGAERWGLISLGTPTTLTLPYPAPFPLWRPALNIKTLHGWVSQQITTANKWENDLPLYMPPVSYLLPGPPTPPPSTALLH